MHGMKNLKFKKLFVILNQTMLEISKDFSTTACWKQAENCSYSSNFSSRVQQLSDFFLSMKNSGKADNIWSSYSEWHKSERRTASSRNRIILCWKRLKGWIHFLEHEWIDKIHVFKYFYNYTHVIFGHLG